MELVFKFQWQSNFGVCIFFYPNSRRWTTKRLACWNPVEYVLTSATRYCICKPSASAENVQVLPTEACEWHCTRICRFVTLKDTLQIASSHLGISVSRWWSTKTLPVILGQNTFSSIITVENGCVTIRHWRRFSIGAMEGFGSFWTIFQTISYCFRYKLEGWSKIALLKSFLGNFKPLNFLEDFLLPQNLDSQLSRGTVDGWNPKQPPGMYKTLYMMGFQLPTSLNWWVYQISRTIDRMSTPKILLRRGGCIPKSPFASFAISPTGGDIIDQSQRSGPEVPYRQRHPLNLKLKWSKASSICHVNVPWFSAWTSRWFVIDDPLYRGWLFHPRSLPMLIFGHL